MKNVTVENIRKDLENALKKGWSELTKSSEFAILKEYSDSLRETGFFESKFRKKIPHPGHDNTAKLIGKYVLMVLIKHEVNLDQFFPGDFNVSTESKGDGYELRNFHMKIYKKGKRLCNLTISFAHMHEQFAFPESPKVIITKIYKKKVKK